MIEHENFGHGESFSLIDRKAAAMMRRACHDQPQQDLHCSDLGEQVVLVIALIG
jgi:hypothetical protein